MTIWKNKDRENDRLIYKREIKREITRRDKNKKPIKLKQLFI